MKIILSYIIITLFSVSLAAQQGHYTISRTHFSTDVYDEFAPVFFKNGVVFCTDRGQVVNSQGKGTIKMFYADTSGNKRGSKPFSKNLSTRLNDGPATFNATEDTIYYSRNLSVEGNTRYLSTINNKLGLFYASAENKGWSGIREIRFNTEWFNITMPALSPDGRRLYFASDRPDAVGGLDIYYSQWENGYWSDPVNLGREVNTAGNETFPFINEAGELYFTSDGFPGSEGKDLYVTCQKGTKWFPAKKVDAPINSEFDDVSIITDALAENGYFSSKRGKTIDIYRFSSDIPIIWFSYPQVENHYCVTFRDTGAFNIDTTKLQYVWSFADGQQIEGRNADYCFPGPGIYQADLNLMDRSTAIIFFRKLTYYLHVSDNEQPFIASPENVVTGENVMMDGSESYCPGYKTEGYYWDFGDGNQSTGKTASHIYEKEGVYTIRLGLVLRSEGDERLTKKAVTREIRVFGNDRLMREFIASGSRKREYIGINDSPNVKVDSALVSGKDNKEYVFRVVVTTSPKRLGTDNTYFRNIPDKYRIKEYYDPLDNNWQYSVDDELDLMFTYHTFSELVSAGYRDTRVIQAYLTDPAEKDLYTIKKNYNLLTDIYFDNYNRLVTSAYLMLDQVVQLMNKYPELKLELAVHSDNQGTEVSQLSQSQARALVMMNYIVSRGVNADRIIAKGYGSSRPVVDNIGWGEKRMNRRIDLTVYRY